MPKVTTNAAREMILKLKEFCETEKQNCSVLLPLNNIRKRITAITDKVLELQVIRFLQLIYISEKIVLRIDQELSSWSILKNCDKKKFASTGKNCHVEKDSTTSKKDKFR